jgi:hypothetical protein
MRVLLLSLTTLSSMPALAQAAPEPASACAEMTATLGSSAPPASGASKDTIPAVSASPECAVPPGLVAPANDQIAAFFAEAERRLASMKFVVGPPPRKLTREADSASRPIS